jgi:hypothetical protein
MNSATILALSRIRASDAAFRMTELFELLTTRAKDKESFPIIIFPCSYLSD